MLPNEPEPSVKPPTLPGWQRLIFCIIIPNAIVYGTAIRVGSLWMPESDNHGPDSPGLVGMIAVFFVAAAALILFLIPITGCTLRAAFYPWRRWYTALAGGFAGVAVGMVIGLAVVFGLKLLSN